MKITNKEHFIWHDVIISDFLKKNFIILYKLFFLLLITISISRLIWYINFKTGTELKLDILKAFWLGLRFDVSALCYVFSPWILAFIISDNIAQGYKIKNQRIKYLLINIYCHGISITVVFCLFFLIVDFIFYTYFQDHINVMFFGFFYDDTWALIKLFYKNYPVIWISTMLLTTYFLSFKWMKLQMNFKNQTPFITISQTQTKLNQTKPNQKIQSMQKLQSKIKQIFVYLIIIIFISLGARGSLSLFPLGIEDTEISNHVIVNMLPFNAFHALSRAITIYLTNNSSWDANLKLFGYKDRQKQAVADFKNIAIANLPKTPLKSLEQTTLNNEELLKKPPHVIFILMESWSNHWMHLHSETMNLLGAMESHLKNDIVFNNFMPTHGGTIGSLGALLVGMIHRTFSPFVTESEFSNVAFNSSPAKIFKQNGYKTSFIYGGSLGWRGLRTFIPNQGFDNLTGEYQIHQTLHLGSENTHDWGTFDENLFKYMLKELRESTKPLFQFVLTTSNHPPYLTPQSFTPFPLKVPDFINQQLIGDSNLHLARLKTFQYANHQLGLFLNEIKKSTLKDNTIVAVTGDHNFYIYNYKEGQLMNKLSVPFYLFIPNKLRPTSIDTNIYGSHHDIFPTLFNLSLSNIRYESLGQNLLNPIHEGYAIHPPAYFIAGQNGAAIINNEREIQTFSWNQNKELQKSPANENHMQMIKFFKSLQATADLYFHEQKINNQNK